MSALEADDYTPPPVDEPPDEEAQRFTVHDVATAEWAMRRVKAMRAQLDEDNAYAATVASWIAGQRDRAAANERWLVEQLEGWHRHLLDEDDRRKTVRLPSGELKARKLPDTVSIADPDEFCAAYAETDLVRVKMTPDLTAVKREVLKRGVPFDGVEVVPGEVRFSISCTLDVPPRGGTTLDYVGHGAVTDRPDTTEPF